MNSHVASGSLLYSCSLMYCSSALRYVALCTFTRLLESLLFSAPQLEKQTMMLLLHRMLKYAGLLRFYDV